MTRKREGFTLIEVLFALFLVTIMALIMAAALPLGHHSRQKAEYQVKAAELCQRQIERLREAGYPNLTPTQLYALHLVDGTFQNENGLQFTNVDGTRGDAVSNVLPSGVGYVRLYDIGMDLRSVVVEVRWNEDGKQRTVEMGTVVANL